MLDLGLSPEQEQLRDAFEELEQGTFLKAKAGS